MHDPNNKECLRTIYEEGRGSVHSMHDYDCTCPTQKPNEDWNRKDMEEKLKDQIRTMINMVNMLGGFSQSEQMIFAGALPNLVSFMYEELTLAEQRGYNKAVEEVRGKIESTKVQHQEFENNVGKLHCDPVTEICEITAHNSALDDLLTFINSMEKE